MRVPPLFEAMRRVRDGITVPMREASSPKMASISGACPGETVTRILLWDYE